MQRFFLFALAVCFAAYYIYKAGTIKEPYPIKRLCLITGCARSGTYYVNDVLRENGLAARHEREATKTIFAFIKDAFGLDTPELRNANNIIVSWTMAVDSSTTPWGPGLNGYEFKHIFHQVRDPLKTINSAADEPEESWAFIRQFIPEITERDSKLVRSAKYWYYWNLQAEKKAEWTYRLEDIPEKLEEMSRRLGVSLSADSLKKVPSNRNTRHHANQYKWSDLKRELSPELYGNIVNLAKRYGYEPFPL